MDVGDKADRMALCRLEVIGHLQGDWSEWFEGMTVTDLPEGNTSLAGLIADQAALRGLIDKVFSLGLSLVSVSCGIARVGPLEHGSALQLYIKGDGDTWQAR